MMCQTKIQDDARLVEQMILFFSINFHYFSYFFGPRCKVTSNQGSISMILIEMCKDVGVSEKNGTPKSSILIGFSNFKPSILGYPYFWKYPYLDVHPFSMDIFNGKFIFQTFIFEFHVNFQGCKGVPC